MALTREDLWTLEDYSTRRQEFRAQVMAHKKDRQVFLGPHATLYFEDALTMKYQIQEMLRVERIFDAAEIAEELETYNPLIPTGSNWKATFMIEYGDVEERQRALATMGGIEHKIWARCGDGEKVYAIANEDLERSRDSKAAAVHFLRFELDPHSIAQVQAGEPITMGIDHEALPYETTVVDNVRNSLAADLAA